MNGFMLDHLQGLLVVLHCNMMSVDVSVELLKAKQTERHSQLMLTYWVSTLVSVLLAKAVGHPFWTRAVPKSH